MCDQKVVDGKDQALFCEGQCQRWLHRYCAGVSLAHFDALSSSSEPFHCLGCFQRSCNAEIKSLRVTVSSLQGEVSRLQGELEGVSKKNCSCNQASRYDHSASSESWSEIGRGIPGGRGKGRGRGGRRGGVQVRNGFGKAQVGNNGGELVGGGVDRPGGAINQQIPDAASPRSKIVNRVIVHGARRIWGTLKSASTHTIRNAVTKFAKVNNIGSIQVKRKYKISQAGKIKWWFVIHAEEETVLKPLERNWENVSVQTGWKLETCTKPADDTLQSSNTHSNTSFNQTSATVSTCDDIVHTCTSEVPSNHDNGSPCPNNSSLSGITSPPYVPGTNILPNLVEANASDAGCEPGSFLGPGCSPQPETD